jgi:hypothetical protein
MYDALRRRGKAPDVARHFQRLVEEAGLVSVRQSGFLTSDVDEAPRFIRSDIIPLLHGLCEEHPLAQWGLAEQGEVDELIRELNEAASGSYEAFFSWILGECIARVPQP